VKSLTFFLCFLKLNSDFKMKNKSLPVRTKLSLGFGILTVIAIVIAIFSLKALGDANSQFSSYVSGINARAQLAESVRTAVDRRAIAARDLVLVVNAADIAAEKVEVMSAHEDVHNALNQLNEKISSATDTTQKARTLVAEITRVEGLYGPVALNIVDAALAGKRDDAIKMIDDQCRPLLAALIKATNNYSDYTAERAKAMEAQSEADYSNKRTLLIATCLGALAAAIGAALLIIRGLTEALGAEPATLGELTQRVASGDLSPVQGAEFAPKGSVLALMGSMQISLVKLISEVRSAAVYGPPLDISGNVTCSSCARRLSVV
jgi:CHASE3 domain sensor protein